MVPSKSLPLIAALVVLGMAASASATWDYRNIYYKWQCWVPGCSSCMAYNPKTCETCDTANGYTLQSDNTCGCAAGYGSYAVPAVDGWPYLPPLCPVYTLYGKTLYSKPYTCWTSYKWDTLCQSSPKTGAGFCQCMKCPAGYTSTGGRIGKAICIPGTTPPSPPPTPKPWGVCKGVPPVPANANNWTPFNGYPCKTSRNPRLQLLNINGQCAATCKTGTKPNPTAPVATCVGKSWVITGNCTDEPAAPTCPGVPMTGANAKPWVNCKDGNTGATCKADCQDGYDGGAAATCGASGWVVVSTCVKKPDDVLCKGKPDTGDNAKPFTNCTNGKLDDTCTAECKDGFDGTADAFCQEDGTWAVESNCQETPAEVTCQGAPEDDPRAEPWLDHDGIGGNVCQDAKPDDECDSACLPPGDVATGSATAYCTPNGWSISIDCSLENSNARIKRVAKHLNKN